MNVEIWSDIACPWCYIGKRRFEAALAQFEHKDQVKLTWRSFELDPSAPKQRTAGLAAHLASKYGTSLQQANAMMANVARVAADEGLTFRFDTVKDGNTFDAHRLVHLADKEGKQDAMKERLFRAYFSEGELMSDHATLARLAGEVGLDPDLVREQLATDAYADEVRDDERTARAFGISGVPFFVVDRNFGASGAQPPATLLELLRRAWAARPAPLTVVGGAPADGCGPDGCDYPPAANRTR